MLRVFLSRDLLHGICQFQDGIYYDMLPLCDLGIPDCEDEMASRREFDRIDEVLTNWYDVNDGLAGVPLLIQCLPRLSPVLVVHAVNYGHLHIVKYLHEKLDVVASCLYKLLDLAAASGHIKLLEYLHSLEHAGCSREAMDLAAKNGHLSVVQFLHNHRHEGCTIRALNGAAMNGHMDVVLYLYKMRSEGCLRGAMNLAYIVGHLGVYNYLNKQLKLLKRCRCQQCPAQVF
ncbi:hypothetical protein LEN26_017610 [Aphanomyces euteiches]|nr:hypothetical protein LEN26_017610 [Aphanomyces euteiches]KAH9106009.1 hypothetical protein AeMF1_018304 [Aphanomyces euteiches]KAH9196961.1 hypothetical protein AeNC1_001040 [Aphanomyces euteiches]